MAGRLLSDVYDWALGDRMQRMQQPAPTPAPTMAPTPAPTPMATPQPGRLSPEANRIWTEWAGEQANRRFKAGDRSPEVLSALRALMGMRAGTPTPAPTPQPFYDRALDWMMSRQPTPAATPNPTPMPSPGVNI